MKMLRYLGLALGVLVALLLLLAGGVALFFDPNDYKAQLQRAVEQRTGRALQLPGRLELSFFPWLAVEFGPAMLGNAPGFGAAPFLEIGRARLGLRLSGLLLRRRLEFDTLTLERPVLRLAIDAEGRDNWSDLVERLSADPASAGGPGPEEGPAPFEVAFSGLRIVGGALSLADARDAGTLEVLDLALETGALRTGAPVDLRGGFTWRTDPASRIEAALTARAALDPGRSLVRLETPRFDLRLRGAGWPEAGLPVQVSSGPIEFDYEAQSLAVPALKVESLGARLEGELAGRQVLDAPQISGPLRLAELSPRAWLAAAGIAVPQTRDPKALGRLAFDGRLEATAKTLALESAKLRLDDSTASGRLAIADLDARILPLRFELAVDRLDLDRYLPPDESPARPPPPSAGAAATPASSTEGAASPGEEPFTLPVETLRSLDVVGLLELARGQVSGLPLSAVRVGVNAQQSKLRLFPLEAAMHGGRYRGDVRVDVSGAEPRLRFDESLTGIDLGPLLATMFETRRFSGRGTGTVRGEARGADSGAWLRSAAGELRFEVADGAIEGADLWYEIRRARSLLRREPPPARGTGAPRTAFTRLQASGRLGGGALQSDDLAMDLQYLRVAGRGRLDLVSDALDWNLEAKVLRIPQDDTVDRELVDLVVPVRVTGTMDSPVVRPDLAGLAKARLREELEKRRPEIEEKKEELKQKLRDRLQDLLKR
ncbi:MAG: AsmA family protein [Steroidobacteraceae bacterium]|jgi:AsmA protein|nr:AsmA family protein [Steroidobacteraceae bacterium]